MCRQVPALCAPYLEAAIAQGVASPAEFHDELARIYLRAVIEQRQEHGADANGVGRGPAAASPAEDRTGNASSPGASRNCFPEHDIKTRYY